jgi:hypothetical protein
MTKSEKLKFAFIEIIEYDEKWKVDEIEYCNNWKVGIWRNVVLWGIAIIEIIDYDDLLNIAKSENLTISNNCEKWKVDVYRIGRNWMDSLNLDPRIDELLIISNMTEIDGIAIIDNFDGLTNWSNFNKFGYPQKTMETRNRRNRRNPEIDEFDGIAIKRRIDVFFE